MNMMTKLTKIGVVVTLVFGIYAIGPATAGEFDEWSAVPSDDLAEARGGTAVATGSQTSTQTITGDAPSGNVNVDGNYYEGYMSNTIINTGNNVTLQNILAIDVCLSCTVTDSPDP